jgi:nudix-type nucleoside diphosphatase, YffH/AdpP family
MSEKTVSIVAVIQDEYDDGIQDVYVKFDDGDSVLQKLEWPNTTDPNTGEEVCLYDLVYDNKAFGTLAKADPNLAYALLRRVTKLVSGPDILPADVATESFVGGKVSISEEEVLHSHWFEVVRIVEQHTQWDGGWTNPNSHTFIRGRQGVATVLYDPKHDKIVTIEEFRIGCVYEDMPWLLGIPTGGLEEDEVPAEGAVRECEEEAGIKPYEIQPMVSYKPSPGFTTHLQHLFYGLVDTSTFEPKTAGLDEESEDIRVDVRDASELRRMVENNEIINGTALMALTHFFLIHYPKLTSDK